MSRGLTNSRSVRPESRSSLANGVARCLALHLLIDPRSLTSSFMNVGDSFAGERSCTTSARGLGWFSCSTNHQTYRTSQPGLWWNYTPIPSNAGGTDGEVVTSPWPIERAADASPPFPPRDRAIVKAIACEAVCQTKLPLRCPRAINFWAQCVPRFECPRPPEGVLAQRGPGFFPSKHFGHPREVGRKA